MTTQKRKRRSQVDKVLAELERCRGREVPLTRLQRVSGSFVVHSRIAELRARGYDITNRTDTDPKTGQRRSFYTLQG